MTDHDQHRQRLAWLRAELSREGLNGFIVPHADEHQSEYLPPSAERLAWLTGFTGSAGTAIVLSDKAAIFVDGRYTLQVRSEVDIALFTPEHLIETPPSKWLREHARPGDRIGYDPWLMTVADVRRLAEACREAEAEFVSLGEAQENPIDQVWADRPEPPRGPVSLHPAEFAGEEAASKIVRLQEALKEKKVDATVLAQADSIAWSFNIRGTDIAHNPVALAWAIVPAAAKPVLFIDLHKLSNAVRTVLADLAEIREPGEVTKALSALGEAKRTVLLDARTTPAAIAATVEQSGGAVLEGPDPAALPRARKNETEIAGARRAHVRDGAAMIRFLAWLDAHAEAGQLDEIAAADELAVLRAETAKADGAELIDLSFDTISGAGPNGAIVHYRVSPATSRRLEPGSLYLVDSGAQYRDGTTDITRTVPIGAPTAEMRDRFTRVLKGISPSPRCAFRPAPPAPRSTPSRGGRCGEAGLDYDHGTGHGVGSFLSVHEGPASISKARRGAARAGHDPVQRARLLQDRRLRHPHREPGARHAAGADLRRRPRDARLRDADALPHRPPADHGRPAHPGRDRMDRRLSRRDSRRS